MNDLKQRLQIYLTGASIEKLGKKLKEDETISDVLENIIHKLK